MGNEPSISPRYEAEVMIGVWMPVILTDERVDVSPDMPHARLMPLGTYIKVEREDGKGMYWVSPSKIREI